MLVLVLLFFLKSDMICTEDLFVPYKGVCALFILFKATFKNMGKKLTQINGSFIDFVFTENPAFSFLYWSEKLFVSMDFPPSPALFVKKKKPFISHFLRQLIAFIVTFLIQYCDLYIMFYAEPDSGPLLQAFKASCFGDRGREGGICTSTCRYSIVLCSVLCVLFLSIHLFYINIILPVYETNKNFGL